MFLLNLLITQQAHSLFDMSQNILHKYVFDQAPKYWFEYITAFLHFSEEKAETRNETHSYITFVLYLKKMSKILSEYKARALPPSENLKPDDFDENLYEHVFKWIHAQGEHKMFCRWFLLVGQIYMRSSSPKYAMPTAQSIRKLFSASFDFCSKQTSILTPVPHVQFCQIMFCGWV